LPLSALSSINMAKGRHHRDQLKLQRLLREIRLEVGLRQIDLAERLNSPQSYVSKYEVGERSLDFLEVREICTAIGISLEDFIKRFESG